VDSNKPKITCFVCNWAHEVEFVPEEKRKVPSSISVVRMMCIGRIDPIVILETFIKGIDGILLVGCAFPDCHFVEGSTQAELTVNVLKKLLALACLEPERLELCWVSPLEEISLNKILEDFSKKIKKLGSSPLAEEKCDVNVLENMLAAKGAVSDFCLRAWIGKEKELTEGRNVYGESISREEFDTLLDEVAKTEFIRHKILLLTKKKAYSVKELANALNLKPTGVLRHILNMRRKGMIALDHVDGTTPLYKALEVS
jgi:coenzyme F420-reducing hydrogenase delta subunit